METFLLSIILLLDLLSIELSINRDNDENQIILRHGGKNRKKIYYPKFVLFSEIDTISQENQFH